MTTTPQSTHGVVTDCMTLTRYLLEEQRKFPEATGDLTQLMSHVLTAVKAVASAVRRAGLSSLYSNSAPLFSLINIWPISRLSSFSTVQVRHGRLKQRAG